MCIHNEGCLQLRDEVIQVMYNMLWKKTREDHRKVEKTNQNVNQAPNLGPKHDKIRARWALNIMLDSMLETI